MLRSSNTTVFAGANLSVTWERARGWVYRNDLALLVKSTGQLTATYYSKTLFSEEGATMIL